eukprot:3727119-Rhodomonas_salina.2
MKGKSESHHSHHAHHYLIGSFPLDMSLGLPSGSYRSPHLFSVARIAAAPAAHSGSSAHARSEAESRRRGRAQTSEADMRSGDRAEVALGMVRR